MTEKEMRAVVAAAVAEVGSLREAARRWGVTPGYLSDCVHGRRTPGPAILGALGWERVVTVEYLRKAGAPELPGRGES